MEREQPQMPEEQTGEKEITHNYELTSKDLELVSAAIDAKVREIKTQLGGDPKQKDNLMYVLRNLEALREKF